MGEIHYARIGLLRKLMQEEGWDAVVVSGSDPHNSEYPAPRWKQVEWLSGFTGEAGEMVVTRDHAGLWTDSRYFIQAIDELSGSGAALHKTRVPGAVGIPEWLSEHAHRVALDGSTFTVDAVRHIESALGCKVVDAPDLWSRIWPDRPPVPSTPVITLDDETTGESRHQKILWLRKFLMTSGCDAILLSSLDEIAWLLNVRAQDIEYNPLVISYLLVTMDEVLWFAEKGDCPASDPDTVDSITELSADGVAVCGYDDLVQGLSSAVSDLVSEGTSRIFIDPSTLNYDIFSQLRDCVGDGDIVEGTSPVILRKAVKNPVEISGIREAFHADGIAMERFLFWLEKSLESGASVSEHDASDKLSSLRSEISGYRGDSFRTISAYGRNAALPHYSTPEYGSAPILRRGLYLTDSGGQYVFGTTDITRTVPVGECSDLEKEDYTLVLKGMIGLASAVFPEGTAGCQLDCLARIPMWRSNRNFGHGTGHGVGFYLCVHEGPQDIRQNFNTQALVPGMVTSDEPGIYREGMHGIRHENILLCESRGKNDFGSWLGFETLTLCHIDTSPVLRELMTSEELDWLNRYNARVFDILSPDLDAETAAWLRKKTLPV